MFVPTSIESAVLPFNFALNLSKVQVEKNGFLVKLTTDTPSWLSLYFFV